MYIIKYPFEVQQVDANTVRVPTAPGYILHEEFCRWAERIGLTETDCMDAGQKALAHVIKVCAEVDWAQE